MSVQKNYKLNLFHNRLRDKLQDLRIGGKITIQQEGFLVHIISGTLNTLGYKNPDYIIFFDEYLKEKAKETENKLFQTPFELRGFAEILNEFIRQTLLKIEDKRSQINHVNNKEEMTGKALVRLSIYLNECASSLLAVNDFLNEIVECQTESDLEYLITSFCEN
jgi:hypothetical protein